MNAAYFWPIYGEHDEVCFPFFDSRRHEHVEQALGLEQPGDAVLLSDGYEAYASYAKKIGVTNAQCWAHSRRGFFEAQGAEPQAAAEALRQIGALYEVEARDPQAQAQGREQTAAPAHPQQAAGGRVLRLGRSPVRAAGAAAEQSADQGPGLCARAPRGPGGLPRRPRRADGHEPSRASPACDSDGQA